MTINDTTVETTSFLSIFRAQYIRNTIFKEIEIICSMNKNKNSNGIQQQYRKGRDIIESGSVYEMIGRYALPWSFIKPYLPPPPTTTTPPLFNPLFMKVAYQHYIIHPNSTLETLKQIIEWSSPTPFDSIPKLINNTTNLNAIQRGDMDFIKYIMDICNQENVGIILQLVVQALNTKQFRIAEYLFTMIDYKSIESISTFHYVLDEVFLAAVLNDYMPIIERIYQGRSEDIIKHVASQALAHNQTTIAEYLLKRSGIDINDCRVGTFLATAATKGYTGVFKLYFIYNRGVNTFGLSSVKNSCKHGHLEILQLIHQYDKRTTLFTTDTMNLAAENGHLKIVQFLHYNRSEGCSRYAMNLAATNGHLDVVEFLHHNRSEGCTTDAMDHAAGRGYLDIVQFLHRNRTEGCTTKALDWAAKSGHLATTEFLHQNRSEGCTIDAFDGASMRGHLSIVQFLHHNRSEGCTTQAMDYAALYGHLNIVQFLHYNRSEGCTTNAMNNAATNGHIEVLKFLQNHRTEGYTFRANDYSMFNLLVDLPLNILEMGRDIITRAAADGNLELVKWLHYNTSEKSTTRAMDLAASEGHLEVVEFLHYNRSEGCTKLAMDDAIRYGHINVVKFLHQHRSEGFTNPNGIISSPLPMVEWLCENHKEYPLYGALVDSTRKGNLGVVKYILEKCDKTRIQQSIVPITCLTITLSINNITTLSYLWENTNVKLKFEKDIKGEDVFTIII